MSNIYMEYLTEDAREELILEKEIDLINTDIDYLFTTYEAVNEEKKSNIIKRIGEKIKKLIDHIINDIIPMIINKLRKKKENPKKGEQVSNSEIKLLSAPNDENQDETKNVEKKATLITKLCIAEGAEDLFNHLEKMSVETTPIINNFNKLISMDNENALVLLDEIKAIRKSFFKKLYDYGKNGLDGCITSKIVLCKDQNISSRIEIILSNMEKELKRLKNIENKNNDKIMDGFKNYKEQKRNAFYIGDYQITQFLSYIQDIIKYINIVSNSVMYVEVVPK